VHRGTAVAAVCCDGTGVPADRSDNERLTMDRARAVRPGRRRSRQGDRTVAALLAAALLAAGCNGDDGGDAAAPPPADNRADDAAGDAPEVELVVDADTAQQWAEAIVVDYDTLPRSGMWTLLPEDSADTQDLIEQGIEEELERRFDEALTDCYGDSGVDALAEADGDTFVTGFGDGADRVTSAAMVYDDADTAAAEVAAWDARQFGVCVEQSLQTAIDDLLDEMLEGFRELEQEFADEGLDVAGMTDEVEAEMGDRPQVDVEVSDAPDVAEVIADDVDEVTAAAFVLRDLSAEEPDGDADTFTMVVARTGPAVAVAELNAADDVAAGLLDGVAARLASPDAAQEWRAEHRHDAGDVGDDDPLFASLAPEQGCPDERVGDEPVEQVGGCFGAALIVGDRDGADVWATDDAAAEVFADFRAEPAEARDPELAPTFEGCEEFDGSYWCSWHFPDPGGHGVGLSAEVDDVDGRYEVVYAFFAG
jgi:hypothetical protein